MGRHVNHYDAQDRIIQRNTMMNKHSGSMATEIDPTTLPLAEQIALHNKKVMAARKIKANTSPAPPKTRFSGRPGLPKD